MAACEPCWSAAHILARLNGTTQADEYRALLAENNQVHGHIAAEAGQDGEDRG